MNSLMCAIKLVERCRKDMTRRLPKLLRLSLRNSFCGEEIMGELRIRFAQVPVSFARKIAQRESMRSRMLAAQCSICGKVVELERCKIDERGKPVHDECYIGKMTKGKDEKSHTGKQHQG